MRTRALGTRVRAAAPPCPAQSRRRGSEPRRHSGTLGRGSRRKHPAPNPHTRQPTHHGKEPYSSRRKTLLGVRFTRAEEAGHQSPIGWQAMGAELSVRSRSRPFRLPWLVQEIGVLRLWVISPRERVGFWYYANIPVFKMKKL